MSHIPFALSGPALPARRLGNRLETLARGALLALIVSHERRALKDLDARALDDLGLSRSDAEREADRPFWDLPWDRAHP